MIRRSVLLALAIIGLGATAIGRSARGSDHGDAPTAGGIVRQDANLTDLHAFLGPENKLVLSLCSNPAIPRTATSYHFPSDVTFDINIDTHSPVDPADPLGMGGTLLAPAAIQADIVYRIRFTSSGLTQVWERRWLAGRWISIRVPLVNVSAPGLIRVWAGLRDDPFIRGPRIGRNVAAIVLEVPLRRLQTDQSTILIWATAAVDEFTGPFQDLAGRSLRSMMPENQAMDSMPPGQHFTDLGKIPDVMIYDLARPAHFPNGRALEDDVVDLVGDPRLLANDAPFPSANDVPFLSEFPYLAPPHPAP